MANPMAAGLDVVGQLSVLAGESPIDVEFRGSVIVVKLNDLKTATRVLRQIPSKDRRMWGQRLAATLERAGLELQVWVNDRQIAGLVPGTSQGRITRWLGVGPLDLKLGAILASLFGRSSSRTPPTSNP